MKTLKVLSMLLSYPTKDLQTEAENLKGVLELEGLLKKRDLKPLLAFIDELAERVGDYDVVCSLGCGVGVQGLADRFPKTPVVPALNTQFMGLLESQGVWVERCAGCGKCRLGEFIGVCPIANCAKHIFNGPCGGSHDGKCEVNDDTECAWQKIYDRAKELGMLDKLEELAEPQDWSTGLDGGPRKVVRKDQSIKGMEPDA